MSKGHAKAHDICKKELSAFIKKFPSDAEWFKLPVDPIALGIPQYKEIIKYPRDLGTIQKRLTKYDFAHFDEFASDVTLVFANAILFNPPDHAVHQSAAMLKHTFQDVYYSLEEHKEIQNWMYPKVPPSKGNIPSMSGSELQGSKDLLRKILSMEDSVAFRQPVGWFQEDLAHYPSEVSRLMDLGTVNNWLSQGVYGTLEQFATDIRQVFKNAMRFNQEGSNFYMNARGCEKAFEKGLEKITPTPSSGMAMQVDSAGGSVPSEQISEMAAKVSKLSSNDLIRLVDEVRAKYSSILTQPEDDQLELDLDLLDKQGFDGLDRFINSM